MKNNDNIKLTQYSHGAGCGCKISPKILDSILQSMETKVHFPQLLVGNEERDDAAVYDLGDGTAIISTTDFFMPIVDDAATFGSIASANAISDIYAMGGTPLLAIAILGWPIQVLAADVANAVIEGSRKTCLSAGIPLAGGHSIDSPEPIFGLAVTGRVPIKHLKKNGGAKVGASLYLTKPLGIGILSTAQKQNKLKPEHGQMGPEWMLQLNSIGAEFGKLSYVSAMTDVTGFGLLGHLSEMCEASDVSAEIKFDTIPWIDKEILEDYLQQGCIPGGTNRNWDSYGHKIALQFEAQKNILADPQTSGGLLVAVEPSHNEEFIAFCKQHDLALEPFGTLVSKKEKVIYII
ncbi:MAG: selenide, water dikinase SelD [Bacteroidetes bacterium]|nr:selenide, water dikinase SelD [Bacteroidota bacterium]MBP6315215.1 selenide, water dikinase SelD [Chitinophagaceae bacterium]